MGKRAYQDVLQRFGGWHIEKLRIARRPIAAYQEAVGQGASWLGGTKHVDRLFHTYAEMALRDPATGARHVVLIEKNQTLNAEHSRPGGIPHSHDGINIDISTWGGVKTLEAYEAAHEQYMGQVMDKDFERYSVRDNNCQVWQMAGLKGNSVATPESDRFVKQGLPEILPKWFGVFLQPITDLGAVVDSVKDAAAAWWSGKSKLASTPISDHIKAPPDVAHLEPIIYTSQNGT